MRRAIVHIGTPRTGTTSLQAVLSAHRRDLAQAGILYPDLTPRSAAGFPHLSHQYLGETLDGRRPRRERTELLAMLDSALAGTDADIAIVSYEGLCLLPFRSRAPAILAGLFARHGFTMEILLTVKAQSLYAQSQYTWRCQFLRERHGFADGLARELRGRRYDYGAMLRGWHARGRRVHVVPVHDRSSDAPLIERIVAQLDFADRIGGIVSGLDFGRRDNPSLGPSAIEVARRLRERGVAAPDRAQARAITDFIAEAARERGLDGTPFRALDAETARRIETDFTASNNRFARQVWGVDWSARVAPVAPAPVNELHAVSGDAAIERHLGEIAAAATARFELRFDSGVGGFLRRLGRG